MTGRWSHFDALIRELGALRNAAQRRTDVSDAVRADMDQLIAEAQLAIHGLADSPDDEHGALAAWELVLTAQDFIEGLRYAATDSSQLFTAATHLRRRALDALRQAARLHGDME